LTTDLYYDFRQAADRPEETIDLGRAALTIAAGEYPQLDIDYYLSRIDQLGASAAGRLGHDSGLYRSIAALNFVLFQERGFYGNRDDYFDPRNSFLNEVLDRKTGIPITLSVLYMEAARRIGLPLHGVGFPGHFLVKALHSDEEIVIDPFNGGEVRGRDALEKMLNDLYGGQVTFRADFLEPVTKKQILKRMLNNLKAIYLRAEDLLKVLSILDRLLILDPGSADEWRDRAVVNLKLECFRQALDDFEAYLRLAPDAEDAATVQHQVVKLRKQVTQIH
jgi:regulator of sirC expression with transglutaminase-like and TPR domain